VKRDISRHMALLTQLLTVKRDIIRHMALLTQLLTVKRDIIQLLTVKKVSGTWPC